MTSTPYDLIVIGSGPAGQKGAIAAAKLGKRVAIVVLENLPTLRPKFSRSRHRLPLDKKEDIRLVHPARGRADRQETSPRPRKSFAGEPLPSRSVPDILERAVRLRNAS